MGDNLEAYRADFSTFEGIRAAREMLWAEVLARVTEGAEEGRFLLNPAPLVTLLEGASLDLWRVHH